MKVKELVNKIGDFGTSPHIYIQKGNCIIGGWSPYKVCEQYGEMGIYSFIAANRGQIKIFVK